MAIEERPDENDPQYKWAKIPADKRIDTHGQLVPMTKTTESAGLRHGQPRTLVGLIHNKTVRENVLEAYRRCGMKAGAARAAGLSKPVIYDWMAKGDENIRQHSLDPENVPLDAYGEFAVEFNKIMAEKMESIASRIDKMGEGGQLVREKVDPRTGQVVEQQWAAPDWKSQEALFNILFPDDSPAMMRQQATQNSNVLEIRIVETDRWREVNAGAGQIIEGEFTDAVDVELPTVPSG